MTTDKSINGRKLCFYGDVQSGRMFLQPVDEHDAELMESEAQKLETLCGHKDWCIVTIPIRNWNNELTPWEADPVFGKEGFGDGADETLAYISQIVIPCLNENFPAKERHYYLCGYSLAGLFALWSSYQTNLFEGIVAASPSVWYPGWTDYSQGMEIKTSHVYLSLGTKEEKTRNQVMAAVGDAIRTQYSMLTEAGTDCTLEWNEGNHFVDSDTRMAKGLSWLLGR